MYYYISGTLAMLETNTAVIDAGGVGYFLNVSGNTVGKLSNEKSDKVKLYTHLAVREDAMELYGFADEEELTLFRLLLSVSGVGAKSAISILSLMRPDQLVYAVTTGDTKSISKAQGIGGKTASRIVLELKDKLAKAIPAAENVLDFAGGDDAGATSNLSEAVNALTVLGYNRSEALSALRGVDPSTEIEVMIREALKNLAKM